MTACVTNVNRKHTNMQNIQLTVFWSQLKRSLQMKNLNVLCKKMVGINKPGGQGAPIPIGWAVKSGCWC